MKTNFFLRLHLIVLIGSFSALSFGQIKLSGFLLDSTTRAVITQQQVILKSQTGQVLLCTSDSSGAFTFKSLKPGHYVVEARANHYQIYKRSLTVTDKNITLKVLLQRNHVVYEPKELHDQVLSLPAKSKEYELGKRESFATMSCAPQTIITINKLSRTSIQRIISTILTMAIKTPQRTPYQHSASMLTELLTAMLDVSLTADACHRLTQSVWKN